MCPIFDGSASNRFTKYRKILWACLLECKKLWNFICLPMKFHNRHHASPGGNVIAGGWKQGLKMTIWKTVLLCPPPLPSSSALLLLCPLMTYYLDAAFSGWAAASKITRLNISHQKKRYFTESRKNRQITVVLSGNSEIICWRHRVQSAYSRSLLFGKPE